MFDLITGGIAAGGVWAVGLLMLIENIFPPIPSELIMPMAGYLAADGQMSAAAVVIAGTIGSVLGALIWFWLARLVGQDRFLALIDRYGFWLTLSREDAERALSWFTRWGRWAVFLGRLVPGVRTLISVPAALAEMPFLPFLAITIAGSLVWVSALTAAGFILKAQYERVEVWVSPVTTILILGVIVVYIWRVIQLARRR